MNKYDTKLHNKCEEIFERHGNLAVADFINEYRPETVWEFCEACDGAWPSQAGICLCCGSPTVSVSP